MNEQVEETYKKIDPDKRVWEYDGDGTKIYKIQEGYGCKTLYTEEHFLNIHFWKGRF